MLHFIDVAESKRLSGASVTFCAHYTEKIDGLITPLSGCKRPHTIRARVVLPDPLLLTKPVHLCGSVIVTSCKVGSTADG